MALENTHYGHVRIGEMLKDCHSIFFVGIGGISLSSLAQISLSLGYRVGGSDRSENVQTAQLKAKGIPVFFISRCPKYRRLRCRGLHRCHWCR